MKHHIKENVIVNMTNEELIREFRSSDDYVIRELVLRLDENIESFVLFKDEVNEWYEE